jgi:tetratricopeptide (TPR) repeat protein
MMEFCRDKYLKNTIQLELIDEFDGNFKPDDAIHWYSRQDSFVYKMVTRACRNLDIDILYKLRFIIQHLHRQLVDSRQKHSLMVYRTCRIRKDLWEKLKSYEDGLLSFNEFLRVSKQPSTSVPSPMNMNSKIIRFQIHLETGVPRLELPGKSNELLLTIGTIFHIDKVESIDDDTFHVKLTTSADIARAGQLISQDLRNAIRGAFPLVRMLKLMRQRDHTDYMTYFASMLMDDPDTINDEEANSTLGGAFHALGGAYYDREDFDQGLVYLEKALKVYRRILPPDHIKLTPTYNNIGSIYFKRDQNEQALEYHKKAYVIQKTSSNPDVESVSAYAQNIVAVLDKMGRHKEAIAYIEIDVKIQEKLRSKENDPKIAVKYHNLGGRQYQAQLYSEALKNYEKCLAIELVCHSADNPTVATTYSNMATALEKLGRLKEAIACMKKAIERLMRTKKEDDQDVCHKKKYLQQLENKLWMKDLLASTQTELN